MFPSNGEPLSIQGERERRVAETVWASDADVEEWLAEANEGWVICKERVRHGYRRAKRGERLHFVAKTERGLYVRRELCPDCQVVELVEHWQLLPKPGTKNIVAKAEMVLSYPNYLDKRYLAKPGTGRLRVSTIRQIIVTEAVAGLDLRALEKEIAQYEAEHMQATAS